MKFFFRKIVTLVITLFIVSMLAFIAFQLISGDPAVFLLGLEATPENVAALRAEMGLDRPATLRYFEWLRRFLFGDMGDSYLSGMTVREVIGNRVSITGALLGLSFLFTAVIALPIGIVTSQKKMGAVNIAVTGVSQFGMAIPPLFLGIILTFVFGTVLNIISSAAFPLHREGALVGYLFLPALAIALPKSAMAVRVIRASVFDEMGKDYVRTAYSRGRGSRTVLFHHIIPNVAVSVITFLLLTFTMMVTDAIVVERIFSIPGAGRLLIRAIETRDYPVVQSLVVIVAAFVVGLNFLTDILCRAVDPRITR